MAIRFDGTGYLTGFIINYTGDFDIQLPDILPDGFNKMIFGDSDSRSTFLANREGEFRFRWNNGGTTLDLPPVPIGTVISGARITRVDGVVTFSHAGESVSTTSSGTPVDIRAWGMYNNGANIFEGEISGVASFSGDTDEATIHDFDSGAAGDLVLVDSSPSADGSNDADLVNFTTGGFEGDATPTPSVADAGADQSNISAGDEVALDSSASTGVVSRVWSEVTSTGVVLSDATAVSPTFIAPSFNAATEITFLLTTTGSDGTDDTDEVSFFVLEDGVVVSDPTITLAANIYDYYTRKADANGEAIFPVSGVISNLPDGAYAEYELDGSGQWTQMYTDSQGNFGDDVIINVQQNLVVRVSSNPDITATARYLTAGMTWLAWWQSNESGRGSSTQNSIRNSEITAEMVRPTMFKDGRWQYIADPCNDEDRGGSTWIRIAVEYAKLGIPIGLINVAVGGTGIERWLPSANDLWDTRIIAEVAEADCGGISATTSLGGESNIGTDPAILRVWFEEMINALHAEFGTVHYLSYVPRTYGSQSGIDIRAEFDYIINNNPYCEFGGDLEPIDVETDSDGTHLKTDSQLNQAALIRFAAFTTESAHVASAVVSDSSIDVGDAITLNATNSQDSELISDYLWSISPENSGVVIDDNSAEITTLDTSGLTVDQFNVELTTFYTENLTSTDSQAVSVNAAINQPPIANAGPDQSVAAATQFTLDGTGSQDTDGTIVEWRWTQTAGDTVTLNLEDPARPTATSPSKTTAQRLTFQLVTVDDEDAVSSPSLVNIDVAAVVQNDVLNIIDKISFTFESDGMITAFPGRANRETFRLKPSDPTGLVLEDGWFDFEANDVRRVEISMLETTGVKIISTDTDSITREKSKLHARMGDMPIKSSTKEFEPTVSVFVGNDERGVVMTAPGLSGAPKVKYYSTTARAV